MTDKHIPSDTTLHLPSSVVKQLVGFGLATQAGQIVIETLLNLNPTLRQAVAAKDSKFYIDTEDGTLIPGAPDDTNGKK